MLILDLEQKDNGARWKNKFDSTYLEEITQRSGVPQKYQAFLRLLKLAINNSEGIMIDILANQDLEKLRSKNPVQEKQHNNQAQKKNKDDKRFFVITVSSMETKYFYPLPLLFEENPDVETLKKTIARLRIEIEDLKEQQLTEILTSTHRSDHDLRSEVIKLRVENQQLRRKLKDGVGEERYHQMEKSLAKPTMNKKRDSVGVTDNYNKQIEDLATELEQERFLNEKLRLEFDDFTKEDYNKRRKLGLYPEEDDFSFARHLVLKHKAETDMLLKEIDRYKDLERSQKLKIREAISQYDATNKKYLALKNQVIKYFTAQQNEVTWLTVDPDKPKEKKTVVLPPKPEPKAFKKPELADVFKISIPKSTKASTKTNKFTSSKTTDMFDTKQFATDFQNLQNPSRESKIPTLESRPETAQNRRQRNPLHKFSEDFTSHKKNIKSDDSDSSIDAREISDRLSNLEHLLNADTPNKFF